MFLLINKKMKNYIEFISNIFNSIKYKTNELNKSSQLNKSIDLTTIQNTHYGLLKLGMQLLDNPMQFICITICSELLQVFAVIGLLYENIFLTISMPILMCLINMKITTHNMKLNSAIVNKWENIVYNFFQGLSYSDRKEYDNMEDFKGQVAKTGWAIARVVTWGFSLLIDICITIINCIIVIIKKQYYSVLFLVPLLFYIYIKYRMVTKQEQLTKVKKTKKEIEKRIKPLSHWYLHLFQNLKRSTKETLDIEIELRNTDDDFWMIWESITYELILVGRILSFISIIMHVKTFQQLLVIKVMFDQLISTITSFGHLTNGLANNIKDFDRFITWVQKVKKQEVVEYQSTLKYPVNIDAIHLTLGEFTLSGHGFSIDKHDKILLRGVSGAGKTQMVNSLQGLISGCMYRSFDSKTTTQWWEYMNQQTREAIPSNGLSLREMLEGETNNELICHLISIVKLDTVFNKDKIDQPMNSLSGGEKMRLSLLYSIWELLTRNKQILILDEPEQGLDEDTRVEVIKNILINIDKPILIIYHGSRLDLLQLPLTKGWVFNRNDNRSIVKQYEWNELRSNIVSEIMKIIK